MKAYVYRATRREGTYVYLAARDDFSRLPPALAEAFGLLAFVLEVELTPGRALAQEDPDVVRENLALRGFHVQFPPPAKV